MDDSTKKPLSIDEATKPVTVKPNADDQQWQDEQPRQAMDEADAGDFATAEELKGTIRKFVSDG